jgi:UDP-N-acetylglucosamine/UDP-N-acetylgalactosamine 4-epimerase
MTKFIQLQKNLLKNKKTWLVTGSAGFIGSNLLESLLSLNQLVIGMDNFDTGCVENMEMAIEDAERKTGKKLRENFIFNEGDIGNINECKKACKGVDYVLHQAALGSVPRSIEDPISSNRANIDGFLNILIASKEASVKRLVYASSSSTYGDHDGLPKIEHSIGNMLSPYAVTKRVNELYADVFHKTYNFESIGLRYFNIFGKRQDPQGEYAAVIPKWIESFIKDEDIYINGDGKTSRDFCYIENVIQMNLLSALTNEPSAVNQIYNVALGDRISLNELYLIIRNHIELKLQSSFKEISYRDFRIGDVLHSQADISKARDLLGYEATYDVYRGLEYTIDWYLENV